MGLKGWMAMDQLLFNGHGPLKRPRKDLVKKIRKKSIVRTYRYKNILNDA